MKDCLKIWFVKMGQVGWVSGSKGTCNGEICGEKNIILSVSLLILIF